MKRLLALLLAALVLLPLPALSVRGEEDPPAEQPPAVTEKPKATPEPTEKPKATPEPTEKPKATQEPTEKPEATPKPTEEPKPAQTPKPTEKPEAETTPNPTEEPKPAQTPAPTKEPEPTETPKPTEKPEPEATPAPTEGPEATAEPTKKPEASSEPSEGPEPEATQGPTEEPKATPGPAEEPEATLEPEATQEPEATEGPHDTPRWDKSLESWKRERAKLVLSGDLREDILTIARSQLGYSADSTCYQLTKSGKKRYYTRYGDWNGGRFCDWCDSFVSFCVYFAGNKSYPQDSSCARHMMRLKQGGYWREWNSYIPRKGDLVFFVLGKSAGAPNHVGLVEEVVPAADGRRAYLVTIEGNQRNPDGTTPCVRRMERPLSSVVGYGVYEEGPVYPAAYTVRSNGSWIIDETSRFFVERPTREALQFLGLENSRYYAYWFPKEPAEPEAETESEVEAEAEPAAEPMATAGPIAEPEAEPVS